MSAKWDVACVRWDLLMPSVADELATAVRCNLYDELRCFLCV